MKPDAPLTAEPDMIREALLRVLASEDFAGAPQLSAFLSFVVAERLAGRCEQLKGYTIAVEALGRPDDFDPQADPIVRVEAGRLRRALELYYATDGRNDPLQIDIPRGTYVPRFVTSSPAPTLAAQDRRQPVPDVTLPTNARVNLTENRPSSIQSGIWRWPLLAALTTALVLVMAIAAGLLRLPHGAQTERAAAERPSDAQSLAQKGLPQPPPQGQPTTSRTLLPALLVTVDPQMTDPVARSSIKIFMQALTDAVSRFDEFAFVGTLEELQASNKRRRSQEIYVIELSAAVSIAEIEGFLRLVHKPSGRVIWNTSELLPIEKATDQVRLREHARRAAIRIAQPYGLLHADLRNLGNLEQSLTCMVSAYDYWRAPTPPTHLKVRQCLEAALKVDPAFHPAWALLAQITLDEHRSGYNPLPGVALDRALASALTARALAPESARAAQAEMDVLFVRGDTEEAIRIGHLAVRRNPYDSDILADVGARLVQIDQPREGLPLLIRAAELNPGRPGWYDFFLFLAARQSGDAPSARYHAGFLVRDEGPLSLLGRALNKIDAGDMAGASVTLKKLAENEPVFRADPRDFLARRKFTPSLADALIKVLERVKWSDG